MTDAPGSAAAPSTPSATSPTSPTSPSGEVGAAIAALLALPGIEAAAQAVRDACSELRWHEALRRRIPEAATESRIRGATANARLDGAPAAVDTVRDLMRGARTLPDNPDPVQSMIRSAALATAETEHLVKVIRTAPMQALVRLHVAAMAGVIPDAQLGRPRQVGEECGEFVGLGPAIPADLLAARLGALSELVRLPDAPAPVVAALAHAEIVSMRPFVRGNGLVARAFERAYIQASGLDPTGVSVPEEGYVAAGPTYIGALTAYQNGTGAGVATWLTAATRAQLAGVEEGRAIADSVLRGRLS